MKQITLCLFLSVMVLIGCNAHNQEETDKIGNDLTNTIKPQTEVKVNKEYDDEGNLIRFDSTYSYYYSNIENDTLLRDSIMTNFKQHFNKSYNFSSDPFFDDLFFQDSLLQYDFYNNDFFIERFKQNHQKMNKLFFEMDSIKNIFFDKQF